MKIIGQLEQKNHLNVEAHAPFGKFSGLVHHSNWRFGFYLDNNYPRKINRDSDGKIIDWGSCEAFTAIGEDNGVIGYVEDGLDFFNDFVGQYSVGDVQFLRFMSINNLKGLYWKETKNFVDNFTSHVKYSLFAYYSDSLLQVPAHGNHFIVGPGGVS